MRWQEVGLWVAALGTFGAGLARVEFGPPPQRVVLIFDGS